MGICTVRSAAAVDVLLGVPSSVDVDRRCRRRRRAALIDGERSQELAQMAQPARRTPIFHIRSKGQFRLIKPHSSKNKIESGKTKRRENGKVAVVARFILAF